MTKKTKVISWIVGVLLVALAAVLYFKFYFVFGDGVPFMTSLTSVRD